MIKLKNLKGEFMKPIKKAVILAAGFGTRFLPFSKSVYKGMLPIIDTPTIELIVNELVESGIEDILMIVGFNKTDVISHFSHNKVLEEKFKDKPEYLKAVTNQLKAKVSFVEQKVINGTGGAILLAEDFTKDEPFLMCFADDLMLSDVPVSKQLIDEYNRTGKAVLGCQSIPKEQVVRCSSVEYSSKNGRSHVVTRVVEKPKFEDIKSTLSTLGRYIFLPSIYDYCRKLKVNQTCNELCITDTYDMIAENEGLIAYEFEGTRYDIGNKFGYLTAVFDYALKNPEYSEKLKEYIKESI